jgi:hypothetical protein
VQKYFDLWVYSTCSRRLRTLVKLTKICSFSGFSLLSIEKIYILFLTFGDITKIFFLIDSDHLQLDFGTVPKMWYFWVYFCTKIFPYIFHIKPLIFITFSWSHSLADFHEIFTFNSRIIVSFFHQILLYNHIKLWCQEFTFVFKS